MVNIRGIFLVALMLSGVMPLSATTLNQFLSSGYPKAGMGVPYGYNSSSMGAGDQSFQWCLDLVSTNMVKPSVTAPAARRRPLVIICGKDSCGTCSAFADMVNKNPRGMPTWFGRLKITTAYFRGTKPACEKARAFIKKHQVGGGGNKKGFNESESVDPCHRVYVYGVYENGDPYFGTIGSIPMTPDTYGTAIAAQIKRFDNDYDNHLYKPPAANAEFTVEDGWLEATPESEQVYVPFRRTNDVARIETNQLVATFSDQSAVTNDIPWTLSSANMEVAVERPATGWGDVGARIRLELLSTNGVSVATNFITCVAATESFLLPSLDTNRLESAKMNHWGVWTLLEGAATNRLPGAVEEANRHLVTNAIPPEVNNTNFTYTVTNLVTTVFTNALDLFLTPEEQQFDADVRACQANVYSVLAASTQKASYTRVVITNYVDEAALAAFGEAAVADGCAVFNFPLTVTATFTDTWRAVDLAGATLAEDVLGTVESEQIVNDGTNIVWCLTNETCSVVGKATTNVVAGVATDVSHEIESRVYRLNVDDTTKTTSPVTQTVPFIQDCVTFTNYVDEVGLAAFGEAAVAAGCAVSNDTVTLTATFTNRWFLVDGVTTNEFPALTPFDVAESVIVTNRIWILTNATDQAVGGANTNTVPRQSWDISADVTNFWYSVAAGTALQTNTVVCTQELITRYTEDAGQVGEEWTGHPKSFTVDTIPFENVWTVPPSEACGYVGGARTDIFSITNVQAENLVWDDGERTGTVTNSVAPFVETRLTNAVQQAETETVITNFATFKVVARVIDRTCEAVKPENQPAPSCIPIPTNWVDVAFTETDLDGFDKRAPYPAQNVRREETWSAEITNTVYWVLANDCKAAQTNDFGTVDWKSQNYKWTNRFYRVTRDQYTGTDIRAFQLRVTGGLVWDKRVHALTNTFDSAAFRKWCRDNNVVCTVIDQRNEKTGASLFTHAKATNGMRGTRFLSRNGLPEDRGRSPEGNTFKVELIRPNGTTNYVGGVQTATEHVVWSTNSVDSATDIRKTLERALVLAKNDPTEGLNNDPATTPLELAFNTVTNQTLSALDTVDVFKLTGAYTNTAVVFTLTNKTDTADVLSFSVCDEAGMEIPPTFDAAESTNRVWVFKADDAVFVKVFTTNALPGTVAYGVGATNAPPCPGTVGFKVTEAEVTEGTTNAFSIVVTRRGYTGAASCTVSLDEAKIPEGERARYVWNGDQTVTWDDLESGDKTVDIGLFDDGIWHGQTALPFTLTVPDDAPVAAEAGKTAFTLNYRDDEVESVGELALADVTGDDLRAAGDGRLYARAGSLITVEVTRRGGSCSNVTGRIVASKADVDVSPDAGQQWSEKSSETNKTFEVCLPPVTGTAKYLDLVLTLVGAGIPVAKGENRVTIRVLPETSPSWDGEASTDCTGVQYTAFEHSVALADESVELVSLQKISGAVPAGLKATLDKADRRLVVAGTPTVATPTNGVTLVYWAKATVGGKTVWTLPVTLHITIRALADVNANFAGDGAKSKTVWTGLALLDKTAVDAGEPARLRGLLDLTVSPKGRTSAKWRTVEGKTVSFSAAGFAGIDEASGDVGLAATRVVAGVTNTLTATLFAAGKMEATIASNDVKVAFGTVEADAAAWSKDHPATDYVGTYVAAFPVDTNWVETVAGGTSPLCSGAATLTFRLAAGAARTGRTMFAGVLPNGWTFSGSATLAGNAALPVLAASATDAFASVLDIAKGGEVAAADRTEPFWAHRERNFASLSCAPALICVGARWTAPDKDAELPLDVQAPGEDGEVVASTRLRLNRTSGVVQGALRVRNAETDRLETHTARGVLVPGGEEGFVPFGAWWWNETVEDKRDDGVTVRKTVRVGDSLGE